MDSVWTEAFNFCRRTDGNFHSEEVLDKQPLPIPAIVDAEEPKDQTYEWSPSHHSYFSSVPEPAFDFVLNFTSGYAFNMTDVWKLSHEYSDGRCALLRWIEFDAQDHPSFQVHFVDQYRKYQGAGEKDVKWVESYLEDLHEDSFSKKRLDSYMDFRIGFKVEDLSPIAKSLEASGSKFLFLDGDSLPTDASNATSLLMEVPG